MSAYHGKFVWYDLVTSNPDAARTFYASVCGWTARDASRPDMAYTEFCVGDVPVGGVMAMPEGVSRPGWIGYVAVDDVDATSAEVSRGGGKVLRAPADIIGIGRFATVADPQGAVLALFTPPPREAPPAPKLRSPGHGGWHELFAGDRDEAFAFYTKLFGWTKGEAVDIGPMGIYQIFDFDGQQAGGILTKPAAVPEPFWGYYFNVADIGAAAGLVRDGGGEIINGPMEVPGGSMIVQCRDPQGAMFSLVEPPRLS